MIPTTVETKPRPHAHVLLIWLACGASPVVVDVDVDVAEHAIPIYVTAAYQNFGPIRIAQ